MTSATGHAIRRRANVAPLAPTITELQVHFTVGERHSNRDQCYKIYYFNISLKPIIKSVSQ